jgi:microcystin degradation protein MlrC
VKLFCATFSHETNRFSPIPTNVDSYREFYLYLPSTGEGEHYIHAPMEGVNLYAVIKERGHEVTCGLAASAQPSRPTNRADYEFLVDELLANLRGAGEVEGVLLFLHGAQVAEGYDDCEGHLLHRIREIVGPAVPIGVEIDLHANVTPAMVNHADIILACKEYPHWDFEDRARQLLELMEKAIRGEIKPVMAMAKVPMFGTYFTTSQPMRGFVDDLYAMEEGRRLLSVSFCHGFALADIEEAGASVLAVTNGDQALAERVANEVAARVFSIREAIATTFRSVDEALDEAASTIERGSRGPVIIADAADNPGGGAPGDSTFLLEAVLQRGIRGVAVAMICDPAAVTLAKRGGVGAMIPLRIGGKTGRTSGAPLDVTARVLAARDDASQIGQGMVSPLGPAVAIEVDGVQIVLNSIRNQTFTPECFTALGIDPKQKKLLIVKSHQHFHEHFSSFASHIIYALPPGTVDMKLQSVPYRRLLRPAWPLDAPPFERFGREWR